MGMATITACDSKKQPITGPQALRLTVDFDPQSLELTYTTTGTTAALSTTKEGPSNKTPAQNTGQSSTLAVTLIFDTSRSNGTSVQTKSDPLVALTQPSPLNPSEPGAPRVVCFQWGSFVFYGTVSSMTQTIDFFSDSGVPLRASVHLSMTEVALPAISSSPGSAAPSPSFGASAGIGASASFGASASVGASASFSAGASAGIGTTPLTLSQAGDTVQGIAARAGGSASWKVVAAANNIDNPRLIAPGTVLSASASAQFSTNAR